MSSPDTQPRHKSLSGVPSSDAAPDTDSIRRLAEAALETVPEAFREHASGLAIVVEDLPNEEICREMELNSPFDILGLYDGVDLTRKSVLDSVGHPDMVMLYRRPILDYWCETGESLAGIVRNVLVHEIGHHFGHSDEKMEAIEAEETGTGTRVASTATGAATGAAMSATANRAQGYPESSNARIRSCRDAITSDSNQLLRLIQPLLRQLGWGRGRKSGL